MGEAWRRARASSYQQQEDRARVRFLRPTLDRLWTTAVAEHELVCTLHVPRADVPLGAEAILMLRDGARPMVVHGAQEIGELDQASADLLGDAMSGLGPESQGIGMLAVRVSRVGKLSDECAVLLSRQEKSDEAA